MQYATKYDITVDGLKIGELAYPFKVRLASGIIRQLENQICARRNIPKSGLKIERRNYKPMTSEYARWVCKYGPTVLSIPHEGKIS